MIGWFTQPYTNLPLLDGPGPHWAHSEYVTQHRKPDGIGTLPSYVSRKPHWNLVGLSGGHRKRLKKRSIKTKISTKKNVLPYFAPNVSNIHVLPKSWLHWSLHTNNVWEDRALGPLKQRCSNVSYARSQVRRPHKHTFVSPTIYFTLLHHHQFTLLYYITNNLFYFTTFP